MTVEPVAWTNDPETRDGKYIELMQDYVQLHDIDRAYGNMRRIIELFKDLVETRRELAISDPAIYNPPHLKHDWSRMHRFTQTLLKNMENSFVSREAVIRDRLQMLQTMMNLRVAVSSSQLAADARKDSSSMTTYVPQIPDCAVDVSVSNS